MSNPLRAGAFRDIKASPRVKLAARLYATGACKTKCEASTTAGLHPNYLTMLTSDKNGSTEVKRLISDTDAMLENEAIEETVILKKLGRLGLKTLAQLLHSDNQHVRFKAAQDLADRSPMTAKTQKLQVESVTLTGQDVKELAAALTEAHKQSERYEQVITKGLVEVSDLPTSEKLIPAPEAK